MIERVEAGSQLIHGKKIEVSTVHIDGLRDDVGLKVDGKLLEGQRRVVVDSDMDCTTVEVELVHVPTMGSVYITGYLVDERDWEILREAKRRGITPNGGG